MYRYVLKGNALVFRVTAERGPRQTAQKLACAAEGMLECLIMTSEYHTRKWERFGVKMAARARDRSLPPKTETSFH